VAVAINMILSGVHAHSVVALLIKDVSNITSSVPTTCFGSYGVDSGLGSKSSTVAAPLNVSERDNGVADGPASLD
jgi:hypothetical protein